MLFILYSVAFFLLIYLHFALAHYIWTDLKGHTSTELDMGYIRVEDYFGQSFRAKIRDWMAMPSSSDSTANLRIIERGAETVFIAGTSSYPAGRREDGILIIEGNFNCGVDCSFERELMIRGNASIGAGTRLQAIAVDGALEIGSNVTVRRWVDAGGHIDIGAGAVIQSKVCSRKSILMEAGSTAAGLYAPEIVTEGRMDTVAKLTVEHRELVMIPHAANMKSRKNNGYDPKKLFAMGGGSYLYNGDLRLSAPLHIRAPLIVKGEVHMVQENFIEQDLKASGSIKIGELSVLKANVFSDANIELGADTYFQGIVHAAGEITLKNGVRGLRDTTPVVVYAGGPIMIESNVVIHGKLSSAEHVTAVSTPIAWLKTPLPGEQA